MVIKGHVFRDDAALTASRRVKVKVWVPTLLEDSMGDNDKMTGRKKQSFRFLVT